MIPTAPRRARLLRPRLASDALPRPRLIARLMPGVDRPLTLVSAPAGYGKTTLLCQWLDAAPARAAWLSLDANDSDLPTFVTAFVTTLHTLWPEIGREFLDLLRLPIIPPPDFLGTALADALLDLPEPTILVLDDYQAINDPAVHAFVTALLDHPAPALHLAIATRVEPPLPLPLLRARDQLAEVRGRDLAFTSTEAQTFLTQAATVPISSEQARLVEQQTEGWAAGLRLAALSLREEGGTAWLARGFTRRRQQHALDFLLDEVLTRLPGELKQFLLLTSVVERVCGPLCEVLLDPPPLRGQGIVTLRQLVRMDLFVMLLGEDEAGREWVRFHPLFREALRERLQEQEGVAVVTDLHRRAAAWFASQELVDEAIVALLAVGLEDDAARLVEERFATMSETVDWLQIWSWLRLLPETLVQRRPGLLLAYANVDHWRGRVGSMGERLRAATALLDAAEPARSSEASALRAQVDDLTALICFYRGDGAGVVEAAGRALPYFPDRESFLGGSTRMMFGLGLHQQGHHAEALRFLGAGAKDAATQTPTPREMYTLALIHLMAGELLAAQRWAARLLVQAERRDMPLLHGWAHYLLGRVAYELNDLVDARAHFVAAANERRTNSIAISESLFGLALTEQALGNAPQSERLLTDLDTLMAETGNEELRPRINTCQARLALQRGDDTEAIRWLETSPTDRIDILLYMVCPSLTAARVLLARGQPRDLAAAEALVTKLRARAEREHATDWVIRTLAVQALVEQARGNGMAALDHLAEALDLAEPGGFVRIFLDLGAPLMALLRGLAARRPPSLYLTRLLAASEAAPSVAPAPTRQQIADPTFALLSVLTDREAEVLQLLAHHLTNKEIAAELSISPMTVKRHISNVFDKLGVGSRRQAIVQATALGLLPHTPR